MTQSFDPYYKWLGIRPKDQPPNHYRLLAIEVFESDVEVIEQGADRQMAHVRTFQTGQHSELSQKLLNEIAAARVCLLNPEKKAEYDRALNERLAVEPPAPPQPRAVQPPIAARPVPLPRPLAPTAVAPLPVQVIAEPRLEYAEVDAIPVRRAAARRSNGTATGLIAGAGAAMVVLLTAVGVIAWQLQSRNPNDRRSTTVAGPSVEPAQPASPLEPGERPAPPKQTSGSPRIGPAVPAVPSANPVSPRPSVGDSQRGNPATIGSSATGRTVPANAAAPETPTPTTATPTTAAPAPPASVPTTPGSTVVATAPDAPPSPSSSVTTEPGAASGPGAIDRIVLWNQHNAGFNNTGTRTCNLILFSDGGEVWRQNGVAVPWQPARDSSCEVSVPGVRADKLRVEITEWVSTAGGLAEVEVFSQGTNVARGQPATASAEHRAGDLRSAARLTDGITSSAKDNSGYWLLPMNRAGWAEIRLGGERRSLAEVMDEPEPETDDSSPKSKPERKSKKNSARAKVSKLRIMQTALRKKLHGRASFNANLGELTVIYDFANKDQLKDFGATDADEYSKGSFRIKANETRRHCVKYQTLVVSGTMFVSQQEGLHLQTTEGVTVRGFGTRSLSLGVNNREGRNNWMTSASVAMEQLVVPFAMDVTPLHIGLQAGAETLSSNLRRGGIPMAGQLELCGGDGGNAFSGLTISGVVELDWAKEFFQD